jgi:GrpB-like predicted nucleotidyltransferase (UPF0157 family)
VFGDQALAIEHIGSTAIPGLFAKPIIDLTVLIRKRSQADLFIQPLQQLGYMYDKPHSSSERHLFRKGNPTEFHLSIAYADQGGFWERQILFRDYLKQHPETREEYAALKSRLLTQDPTAMNSYIAGKSEFVKKVLELAEAEKYSL